MDEQKMEKLLREYGASQPPERLLSESAAAELREKLAHSVPTPDAAALPPRFSHYRIWLAIGLATAAVLSVLALRPLLHSQLPTAANDRNLIFQADGAFNSADLFHVKRGAAAPQQGEFYVGVQSPEAAFVLLFACTSQHCESLALDPRGSETTRVEPGISRAFGGYDLGPESDRLNRIVVLLLHQQPNPTEMEKALAAINRTQGADDSTLETELHRALGGNQRVGVRVIPTK